MNEIKRSYAVIIVQLNLITEAMSSENEHGFVFSRNDRQFQCRKREAGSVGTRDTVQKGGGVKKGESSVLTNAAGRCVQGENEVDAGEG